MLQDGDTISRDATGSAPDTTDLLTGLSTAVTGGSYADLKVIVEELVKAFDGRGKDVRTLVRRLDRFVTTVNDRRDEIDVALDGLDRLSAHLADDTDSLAASTVSIAPAVRQLAAQQDDAMRLVTALTNLGDAGTDVIERTRGTIGRQVRDLDALLKQIVATQESIGPILTGVQGFADGLDRATPGDYAMFDLTILGNPYLGGNLPLTKIVPDAGPDAGPPPLDQLVGDLTSPTGPLSSLLGLLGGPR
jgi:phospholipid/cholesterol/gamma-HCH transport system substrate-binding protein